MEKILKEENNMLKFGNLYNLNQKGKTLNKWENKLNKEHRTNWLVQRTFRFKGKSNKF